MFTSILCPIDFSASSTRALDYALALAVRSRAHLTLVHVADLLLVEAATATYGSSFVKDESERELGTLASAVLAPLGDAAPASEVVVRVGDAAAEILKCAGERGADCIVMGTQGLSGYKKMFFGSVTEHVLGHSRIPVLAVPNDGGTAGRPLAAESSGPIMAPVDFSARSAADVRIALQLAKEYSAPLLVVHVVSTIRAATRWHDTLSAHERILLSRAHTQMAAFVATLGGETEIRTLVTTGSPADEIGAAAAEHHAGLIVMGLVRTAGLLGARPGRVAYRVLCLATAPVLALPLPD